MSAVRRLASVVAVCALAATALATSPAQAAAPPGAAAAPSATAPPEGCWGTGPVATDPMGVRWPTRYCHAYRAGDVHNYVDGVWQPIGRLNSGDAWFACQAHGPDNPPVDQWLNDIWLYTEADEFWEAGGWGGFPATHVSGGDNYGPIPELPWCPWEEALVQRGVPEKTGARS